MNALLELTPIWENFQIFLYINKCDLCLKTKHVRYRNIRWLYVYIWNKGKQLIKGRKSWKAKILVNIQRKWYFVTFFYIIHIWFIFFLLNSTPVTNKYYILYKNLKDIRLFKVDFQNRIIATPIRYMFFSNYIYFNII